MLRGTKRANKPFPAPAKAKKARTRPNGYTLESVEKVDTLLDGNAVRSKIKDFRTALYPRQYHLSVLEKPLIKRLFAYKVFFRRTCRRKNKIRLTAAEKLNLRFIDRLSPVRLCTGQGFP